MDSGKTPRVQMGGEHPAPAPSSMPPLAQQAVPSVNSKDKMRLVSKETSVQHIYGPQGSYRSGRK